MPQQDEGGGAENLLRVLTELSETGEFQRLRQQYDDFIESRRDELGEHYEILRRRDFAAVYDAFRKHGVGGADDQSVLCILF